jgi:hypothetical protein
MNTSTQPPEGAGGSRSRAAGELTLGLMSGEKHVGVSRFDLLPEQTVNQALNNLNLPG